jgi:hypothetical protein
MHGLVGDASQVWGQELSMWCSPACRRWVCEHGDQARQLQGLQEARQQALDRMEELTNQLQQEQQQLAQQRDRYCCLDGLACSCGLPA